MESPSFHPSSPATPLHPVSPDRTNRQPIPFTPSRSSLRSPGIKEDPFISGSNRNSDVQGKVLQFNQLAESLSPKRKDNDAALRRAVLGREEAESRMKMLEDENYKLQLMVEEGRARELKVAQRLETMMEEVQHHKEAGQKARSIYEKEIRRAKKEVFSMSSTHVLLQEELKTAKNRYTLMREDAEAQKRKAQEKEEEAFAAQYKLVGMQEAAENLLQRLKLVEGERDTLRTNLKEEEIARIAAEGKIPLPPSTLNDEFSSPRRSAIETPLRARKGSDKENVDPVDKDYTRGLVHELQMELAIERRRHQATQGDVNFMKLECQLLACSCRRAEQQGANYIWDESLPLPKSRPASAPVEMAAPSSQTDDPISPVEESVIIHRPVVRTSPTPETLIEFSPVTGTLRKSKSPSRPISSISDTLEADQKPVAASSVERTTPPIVSTLAPPPLAPTDVSESPSVLSLPGRASDDCHMIASVPADTANTIKESESTFIDLTTISDADTIPSIHQPKSAPKPQPKAQHSPDTITASGAPRQPRTHSPADTDLDVQATNELPPRPASSMQHTSRPPASKTAMRFIQHSQTIKIPLADPATPHASKEKARMPFTPAAAAAAAHSETGSDGKTPFTPGATKTREEALQSIRKWREGNSRASAGDKSAKVRARSVTTGSATPRRPLAGGSPARRDISAPETRKAAS